MDTEYRSKGSWTERTGTTPRFSLRLWTASRTWGRCPTTSPCTWTPATTRTRPVPNSPPAACEAASRTEARRRRSRPTSGGTSSTPSLAERLPPARPLLRTASHDHRRLLRPCRHDHHRPYPDPPVMDDPPLGQPPEPPPMSTRLSVRALGSRIAISSGPAAVPLPGSKMGVHSVGRNRCCRWPVSAARVIASSTRWRSSATAKSGASAVPSRRSAANWA